MTTLRNADDDIPRLPTRSPCGATMCALCKEPFSSDDPPEMKYGQLYHRDICLRLVKPIVIAAD
jgi:hypothetical protein